MCSLGPPGGGGAAAVTHTNTQDIYHKPGTHSTIQHIPLARARQTPGLLRTAAMPERSKGFRSSRNIFVCLGSNPSVGIYFFLTESPKELCRGTYPVVLQYPCSQNVKLRELSAGASVIMQRFVWITPAHSVSLTGERDVTARVPR